MIPSIGFSAEIMESFLKKTADYLLREYKGNFSGLCVVLPNKRGGVFLKEHLRKSSDKSLLAPTMISVEDLVEELSGMVCADSITLSIHLYLSWISIEKHKEETFTEFLKWSNTVLHDFNEADRHAVNTDDLFRNLSNIRHIENWSLSNEPLTEFQQRYLDFMDDLGVLYHLFKERMLEKGMAWQGLAYRMAAENPSQSSFIQRYDKFIFCGFNALNVCERKIFSALKKDNKADFLWDIDRYYFDDKEQEAGNFLRKNFENELLRSKTFISDELLEGNKEIEIIANAGSMGQALIASARLEEWTKNGNAENTAVVLADENLLFPVLSSLPSQISKLNVTLEYPLRYTTVFDFYELLLQLQVSAEQNRKNSISVYHKDFFRIFRNPCFEALVDPAARNKLQRVAARIRKYNISFVSLNWLEKAFPEVFTPISFLFEKWNGSADAVTRLKKLNLTLKEFYSSIESPSTSEELQLEYVIAFENALTQLDELINEHAVIKDVASLYRLMREVVSDISVPFYGEPLSGLQVMGVLETRTLDFERLIILGMNEGILPAGKGGNSFIPYDLKRYFGMPLHSEKDAVYAYHFYRLLQRAKNICLVYNSEADTFGAGEKSRFLTQIIMEMREKNRKIGVTEFIASTPPPAPAETTIAIEKSPRVLELLREKCGSSTQFSGLSPSSINLYKDCSLKFWYKYIASIKEEEEVEEDMEAGTFGSILHLTLENLYKPFVEKQIKSADIRFSAEQIEAEVKKAYREYYPDDNALKGKNLLAVNVIQHYVKRMLDDDKKLLNTLEKKKESLVITGLEKELSALLEINGVEVKVFGKMDRMDLTGNLFRIVDYKSSVNKDKDNFIFQGFETLFSEKKNNKLIQLFIYAWLAHKNNLAHPSTLTPCIIPFKNYSGEPNYILGPDKNRLLFTEEILAGFEEALIRFISGMLSASEAFVQTEESRYCEYCGYSMICNR